MYTTVYIGALTPKILIVLSALKCDLASDVTPPAMQSNSDTGIVVHERKYMRCSPTPTRALFYRIFHIRTLLQAAAYQPMPVRIACAL